MKSVMQNIEDFRETGLLMFTNSFLHVFGWALIVKKDANGNMYMYPERSDFRGFNPKSYDAAFKKLHCYLESNITDIRAKTFNTSEYKED